MTELPSTSVVLRCAPGVELQHGHYRNLHFPKHAHDFYSVSVNFNGLESIWLDGKTYTASPGQITAYNPGQVQSGGNDQVKIWEMRALHFDVAWIHQVLGEESATGRGWQVLRYPIIDDAEAFHLLKTVAMKPGPLDPLNPDLVEFAGLLFRRYGERPEVMGRRRRLPGLTLALEYIRDNVDRTISLADLSEISCLSPYYLTRGVRRLTGLPPHQYQLQLRIQQARRLLSGRRSIAQVAQELGFADQSHFHRCFRQTYGVTPGQYRKASR